MAIEDMKIDELPEVLKDDSTDEPKGDEGPAAPVDPSVSQDDEGVPSIEPSPIDSTAHVDDAPSELVSTPEETPVTERKEGDYSVADAALENIGAVSEEGVHEEGPGEDAEPAVQPTGDAPELKAPVDEQADSVPAAEEVADIAAQDAGGKLEDAAEAPSEAADEAPKADAAPELSEAHPEAQAAVDAAPGPLDELRQAGNIVAPALKQLADHQDAIDKLEGEAHARFTFLRQKMTEALAALESVFKYD